MQPGGGAVSNTLLAISTVNLNARIWRRGLSSREMLTQRDQFSNSQTPVSDRELIIKQYEAKLLNHPLSEKAKAPSKEYRQLTQKIRCGDLVYLHKDKNKNKARDRYLVTNVQDERCFIKKFVGNQLRNTAYKVPLNECFRVPYPVDQPFTATEATSESEIDEISPDTHPDVHMEHSSNTPHNMHVPPSARRDMIPLPPNVPPLPDIPHDICPVDNDKDGNELQTNLPVKTITEEAESTLEPNTRPRRERKLPGFLAKTMC